MAKGDVEKKKVLAKILEVFPNSFEYEKNIYVTVDGVQIKLAMTCPKVEIAAPGKTPVKASSAASKNDEGWFFEDGPTEATPREPAKITEEEIDFINELMKKCEL